MRRFICLYAALFVGGVLAPSGWAEPKLHVAATLSTFADLIGTIGGDHVDVSAVASPKFNPHFIEPKPSDILKLKKADLFVHAGLDLEAWRGPLVDAAGVPSFRSGGAKQLDLSQGIPLLQVPDHPVSRAEGDIHIFGNPHYWISPDNAKRMAKTIADKLSAVDPSHASDYNANLQDFLKRMDAKIPEWQAKMKPYVGAELIGYHDEWPYLMEFFGLKMENFLEPKPGIPPTPKQMEFLEQYIKQNHVKGIVQSSYFPTKAADTLAERTGAKVVMLVQGVGENPDASDYIAMLDYDVNQLAQALQR